MLEEYIDSEIKLINYLGKELKSDQNEISKILANRNHLFLPPIQILDKNIAEKFPALDYKKLIGFGYSNGDLITRIKSFKKNIVAKFLGITENKSIFIKNYIDNEIQQFSIHDDIKEIKGFIPVQENMFSIYDFKEIDHTSLENQDNYEWRMLLKFDTEQEMKAFVYFLKDFRRRANLRIVLKLLNEET